MVGRDKSDKSDNREPVLYRLIISAGAVGCKVNLSFKSGSMISFE